MTSRTICCSYDLLKIENEKVLLRVVLQASKVQKCHLRVSWVAWYIRQRWLLDFDLLITIFNDVGVQSSFFSAPLLLPLTWDGNNDDVKSLIVFLYRCTWFIIVQQPSGNFSDLSGPNCRHKVSMLSAVLKMLIVAFYS